MKPHPLERLALEPLDLAIHGIAPDEEFGRCRVGGAGTGTAASNVRFKECVLAQANLDNADLTKLRTERTLILGSSLAGVNLQESSHFNLSVRKSRLTGLKLTDSYLEDCEFLDCTLSLSLFRFAQLKRVTFTGCSLRGIDLSSAKLKEVRFIDCDLGEAEFSRSVLQQVDLRGSTINGIQGVLSLKGATISSEQLMGLAHTLAGQVGITVSDEAD